MNITIFKNGVSTSNAFTNQNHYNGLEYSNIKTSNNGSNILKEINIQNKMNQNFDTNVLKNDEETDNDENDVTLEEKMLNDVECLLYNNNNNNNDRNQESDKCINRSNSHSLPQLPIYSYPNSYATKTMSEHEKNSSNDLISKFSEKNEHYFTNSNSREKYSSNESIKSMYSSSSAYSDQNKNKKENKESNLNILIFLFFFTI